MHGDPESIDSSPLSFRKDPRDVFTWSEKTDKKYTVGYALSCAKRLLGNKKVCTNAISRYSLSDKITLQQVNELRDRIVDDSLYHGGYWCG